MDIRTFRAKTMREALALVRRELGPGAAVLHSREIRRSSFGKLLYGTGVEVTASPELPVSMQPKPMMPAPSVHEVELQLTNRIEAEEQSSMKYDPVNRIKHLEESPPTLEPIKTGFPLLDGAPLPADTKENPNNQLVIERLRERLFETDLSTELIDTLCKQAAIDFEHAEELDLDIVIEHAVQSLSAQLLIADPITVEADESHGDAEAIPTPQTPKMIALVGPTGVGKTTTIAKLAATLSVTQGYRVGLITLDSYRVAAIEQLRTYANLLGLPFEVAGDAEEIANALQAMQGLDLVLIDTDGRSPRDQAAIEHMQSLLEQFSVDDVHLVLAASTSQRGLSEAIRAFSPVKPTQLLLTKIDETPTLGHIVKTSHDAKLPIGYLTDGQGVPEDLAMADAESFSRSILGT